MVYSSFGGSHWRHQTSKHKATGALLRSPLPTARRATLVDRSGAVGSQAGCPVWHSSSRVISSCEWSAWRRRRSSRWPKRVTTSYRSAPTFMSFAAGSPWCRDVGRGSVRDYSPRTSFHHAARRGKARLRYGTVSACPDETQLVMLGSRDQRPRGAARRSLHCGRDVAGHAREVSRRRWRNTETRADIKRSPYRQTLKIPK